MRRRVAAVLVSAWISALGVEAQLQAATLDEAQRLFYTALFQESAAAAKAITDAEPGNLAAWEVRTSALHFQLRRLLGEPKDRKAAMAKCAECRAILATFLDDVDRGRAAARERVAKAPDDEEAQDEEESADDEYEEEGEEEDAPEDEYEDEAADEDDEALDEEEPSEDDEAGESADEDPEDEYEEEEEEEEEQPARKPRRRRAS